jgi:hypothetical protein
MPSETRRRAHRLTSWSIDAVLADNLACRFVGSGLNNSKGVLSAGYQMDVTDPQWDSHPGMQKFRAFMAKYYPEMMKFTGEKWQLFGPIIDGHAE